MTAGAGDAEKRRCRRDGRCERHMFNLWRYIRCGCHVLITGAGVAKVIADVGATCSVTGAGAAQVSSGANETCSITGAGAA